MRGVFKEGCVRGARILVCRERSCPAWCTLRLVVKIVSLETAQDEMNSKRKLVPNISIFQVENVEKRQDRRSKIKG